MFGVRLIDLLISAQFLPGPSAVRGLDARTRLLAFGGLLLLLVLVKNPLLALVGLIWIVAVARLARVPAQFALRTVGSVGVWLILIAALQIAFGVGDRPGCTPLWVLGPVRVTGCVLSFATATVLRFVGMVLLTGLFVWTTPIPEVVQAIEALAAPLDRVGLPAHQVAMVGVIAVRFVPTMALELERLRKAQAARGADIGLGREGFTARVRRTLPLIVPLFVLALRRAECLAEAMEARAYGGGRRRSRYVRRRLGWIDGLALAGTWAFVLAVLAIDQFILGGVMP